MVAEDRMPGLEVIAHIMMESLRLGCVDHSEACFP